MFKANDYAFQIEVTLRAIFKCNRYGIGGIVDADFIEKQPFIAIAFALGNYYNKIDISFKDKIDDFFKKYHSETGKSINEIGEEKIKEIISDFNNIIATI